MKRNIKMLLENWPMLFVLIAFVLAGVIIGISFTAILEKLSSWEFGIAGLTLGALIEIVTLLIIMKEFLYHKQNSDELICGKEEENGL